MDDLEFALKRVDVARQYAEYIPEEGEDPYPEEDEREKFNNVLNGIEGSVKRKQEELEENDPPIEFPIESETDIMFAIATILNQAEENGIDPEDAKEKALGYVKGRQTETKE